MNKEIETLKMDLKWQLSFEEIDWDYFQCILNEIKCEVALEQKEQHNE